MVQSVRLILFSCYVAFSYAMLRDGDVDGSYSDRKRGCISVMLIVLCLLAGARAIGGGGGDVVAGLIRESYWWWCRGGVSAALVDAVLI